MNTTIQFKFKKKQKRELRAAKQLVMLAFFDIILGSKRRDPKLAT